MILLAAFVVVALLLSSVAFTVDELRDIVLIKQFGRVTRVLRGTDDGAAGLHFKWPWPVQRLVRYDARTFVLADPYTEVSTEDQQNLLVTAYCTWRIADPRRFNRSVTDFDRARQIVRDRLSQYKNNVVASHPLEDFVNTNPKAMQIPAIEAQILERLQEDLSEQFGISVTSVGIKRIGLPEGVSAAVIEAQRQERQQYVQQYRTEGEALATAIRARARRASERILAFARAQATEIRAEGDRAAAQYYKQFQANERLAMFLRALESLRSELDSKTVFILDGSELPGVGWFRDGPSLPEAPAGMLPDQQPARQPAAEGEQE
jgi:membrane protease subunit HflC